MALPAAMCSMDTLLCNTCALTATQPLKISFSFCAKISLVDSQENHTGLRLTARWLPQQH
jgi:hypothetical protein